MKVFVRLELRVNDIRLNTERISSCFILITVQITFSLVYTNIFIQDYTIAKYILIKGAFLYRLVTVKKIQVEESNITIL